jgi:hypothetical protein
VLKFFSIDSKNIKVTAKSIEQSLAENKEYLEQRKIFTRLMVMAFILGFLIGVLGCFDLFITSTIMTVLVRSGRLTPNLDKWRTINHFRGELHLYDMTEAEWEEEHRIIEQDYAAFREANPEGGHFLNI